MSSREPFDLPERLTTVPLAPRVTILAALLLLPLSACAEPQAGDSASSASSTPTPTQPLPTKPLPTVAAPTGSAAPVPPPGRTAPPPLSRTVPPTIPAVPKPPKPTDPTDKRASDLVSGHITRGGSGPCYGLVSEDGIEYAVHGTGSLTEGSFVTLRVISRSSEVDCGPGVRVSIVTR
ncbi:hypothetical protein [Micromonospora orduensis]|uniref:hypothetical protein n=1 Tax=Micromonospora orduensis TaxID=1420891 RepID=UPI0033F0A5F6